MDRLDELRAAWHKASEKDRPQDALQALLELERLEAHEPRWSQRLGEAYRRAGKTSDAVEAFARAFVRYFERGFLPRAIAMAKLVKALDAARGNLLEAALPGVTAAVNLPGVTAAVNTAPGAAASTPVNRPGAVQTAPVTDGRAVQTAPVTPGKRPALLTRADDSRPDEVRFRDAPESSIEIVIDDLSEASVILIEDDEKLPSTKPAEEPGRDPSCPDVQATMATFRLFGALPREALVALSDAAELVEFVPGAMIIVRDERAFALYGIVSGIARVTLPGNKTEIRLQEGDVFGEASLLEEGTRQANVRAETPLMTLRIEKSALEAVMKAHPAVEAALFDLLARRLISNLLGSSPLFSAFDPSVRLELAQKFEVRRAPAGTVIAERGRRSDGLYVLLAGSVVAEPESGKAARIARGTAFGHGSLLGTAPADTTIRAASEAVLLRMPAAGFTGLAALYPPVLAHLSETANEPLPVSRREP